jgi:uncharacterized protein (DUF1501 family)
MTSRRHPVSRRGVLGASASALGLGLAGWWPPRLARAGEHPIDKLVFLVLCGGADGLSLVVPHGDDAYQRARARTRIAAPGRSSDAAVDLDGYFGLHPRLAPLRPLYDRAELGAIVAVGQATRIRSHAAARLAIARAIAKAAGPRAPMDPAALDEGGLARAARWIREDPAPGTVILESDGWDTHVAQGTASGRLARRVVELASALVTLRAAIGPRLQRTAVVVLTEFGRSLSETPMGGTDDGHAGAMLYLGGAVAGGRVLGTWPGLDGDALSEGRHLRPTTSIEEALTAIAGGREA